MLIITDIPIKIKSKIIIHLDNRYFNKYFELWQKNQRPFIRSKEYRDFEIVKKIAKKNNTIHSFHEDLELKKYFLC